MIRKQKNKTLLFCFTLFYISVYSQSTENMGWLFLTHTQKLSKKFEALADVQMRTGNKFIHFETLLLRGGLGYKLNKDNSVAIGYTFKGDWTKENGKSMYSPENRIYEQYLFNTNIRRTELTFRFRQEQRFVKDNGNYNFSQRSRFFISAQIPLAANADFSKGLYTAIQDEIFVNSQHKEMVNNSFFDQNRPFVSIGYRWSKKVDTEIGYMRWLQRETEGDISANVCQIKITTEL